MFSTVSSLSKMRFFIQLLLLMFICLPQMVLANNWSVSTNSPDIYKLVHETLRKTKFTDTNQIKQEVTLALRKERYLTSRIDVDVVDRIVRITGEEKYMILFSGNVNMSDAKIKNTLNLSEINSTTYSIEDDVKNLIVRLYEQNGYVDTKVKSSKGYFKKDKLIRLNFDIKEGQYISIGKIKVNGSYSKPEKYYVNFIKKHSSSLVARGGFSNKDLENGINNLITDLKNQGFLEATITGIQIIPNRKAPNIMDLIFDLNEGKPTIVDSITFKNNQSIDSEWLEVLLGLREGNVINFYKLEEGLQTIMDYFLSTGYLKAEINPAKKDLVQINQEQRLANIEIEIVEGPKIIVGEIQIKGNAQTQSFAILKSLDFEVGDVLTVQKLKNTRTKLGFLSLFSRVDIQFIPLPSGFGHSVQIDVAERKPGLVQFGFGANNLREFTLRGYTGVLYRNLWGTARAINTRLELQSSIFQTDFIEYRAFTSFFEPFLFGSSISGRINADISENIFEIKSGPPEETTLVRNFGLDFILESQLNRNLKTTWTVLGIDQYKEYERNDSFAPIEETILSLATIVDVDFRNNQVLPTKGFYTRFEAEYAPGFLGSRIRGTDSSDPLNPLNVDARASFIKAQASYTRYDDINENLIWVNTVRGGILKNLSKDSDLFPKSRAFFLGGATTIRGFDPSDPNERIPSDQDLQGLITGTQYAGSLFSIPGYSYYYLFKTEFRFPLYKELWGSFFYDGGAILIDGVNFADAYRDSAGLGIRYNTPVGAFSLEIGFKLDRKKDRGESPNQFHISIGTF